MRIYLVLIIFVLLLNPVFSQARVPVKAKRGMVVSAHSLASEIGIDVLKKGGNAIDAAVATAFALAVVYPSGGNIGGGGFLVYLGANGKASAFDFRETAPEAAHHTMFLDSEGRLIDRSNHRGGLSVGVPGTVAGLTMAHSRFGKLPFGELLEPAIELAQKGFPVNFALHEDMIQYEEAFKSYPSTARAFLKGSIEPYEHGELLKQPDLANTLRIIKKHGKEGFYSGSIAKKIVDTVRMYGGIITLEDLRRYRAVERMPTHIVYKGYDVYSMPSPSSGGIVLCEMLNVVEEYDLKTVGHNSAKYLHILTETMKMGFLDRAIYLGDQDFNNDMPVKRLLSKSYAGSIRDKINMHKAVNSSMGNMGNSTLKNGNTTHISVMDSSGNAVSLTYTIEQFYGSKIVVEGAGFFLNNEMGDFNPVPGITTEKGQIGTKPNLIAPGKRMLSSMTPTIVAKDGKAVLILGSPGGRSIINTVFQVILNVIDHGMNIAMAVEAGRIHHQWFPDITYMEKWSTTKDSLDSYKSLGHKVKLIEQQGAVMAIHADAETGIIEGISDGRRPDGAAVGY